MDITTTNPKFLASLETEPHRIASKLPINDLVALIKTAADAYYNTDKPLITDTTYDILIDILKFRQPDHPILGVVGSPVEFIGKVKLPYWMGSADKVKPNTKALTKWLSKFTGPYLIADKLDGLSGLLTNTHLYTRGDGSHGSDISKLINHISGLKSVIDHINGTGTTTIFSVRGEIIIKKHLFEAKYADTYPKARSLVAGVVGSVKKNLREDIAKHLDFVAYEVIEPSGMNIVDQYKWLIRHGFKTPNYNMATVSSLNSEILTETLLAHKKASEYVIDGIVITDASRSYPRNTSGNPDYMVAFKMLGDEDGIETTVLDVEWNPSKSGILNPTVIFKPVIINGDTVQRATGIHARNIYDNRIGQGAIISVVLSGDVIPCIIEVKKPADGGPSMPPNEGTYWKWSTSGIEAILIDIGDNIDVQLARLNNFFTVMKVKGVGLGIITKLYNAGYITINQILRLTPSIIAELDGFQERSAVKIVEAMSVCLEPTPIERLMVASALFVGIAEAKIKLILKEYTPVELMSRPIGQIQMTHIAGISDLTQAEFHRGLPLFREWMQSNPLLKISGQSQKVRTATHPLNGKRVVFSGFRDETLKTVLEGLGCDITTSVSKNTDYLVIKDESAMKGKAEKARELGVPIILLDEFRKLI